MILLVPAALAAEHLVRPGDTLASIAAAWGTDVPTLERLNGGGLPGVGGTALVPDPPGTAAVPAVLSSVVGTVHATDPAGAPIAARIGAVLPVGSTLCTGPDSWATVRLAATRAGTHDDLSLASTTCVQVKSATTTDTARRTRVRLTDGSLSVRASESPGELVVDTPAGVAAGTGGGFRVHLEAQRTRLEALEAAVAVLGAGEEVRVDPGFGTRVAVGRAPDAPTPLPPSGTPALPEDGSALVDPVFAWTSAPRALGYRVELSSAPDFSEIVWSEDVSGTAWSPEVLFLPFRVRGLWWRVATLDRTGFLGIPSAPRALAFPAGLGP